MYQPFIMAGKCARYGPACGQRLALVLVMDKVIFFVRHTGPHW